MNANLRRYAAAFVMLGVWMTMPPPSAAVQPDGRTPTKTGVTVSKQTSTAGEPVRLTVTVTALGPEPGIPAGRVEFFSGRDSLGTAVLSPASDHATAAIDVTLSAGVHPLIAEYQGSDTHAFSISAPPVPHEVLPSTTPQ